MSLVKITDHGFKSIDLEREILESAGFKILDIKPKCTTEDDVIRNCSDADVLIVQWAPITRRVLESLPQVKCIVRYGIGVNNIDIEAAKELGVMVANVPDYCLEEVSNHALAMILSLSRRIPHDHHQMVHGGWGISPFEPISAVSQMQLGLIGFGNIGRRVAQKAQMLSYQVAAYDPYVCDAVFAEFDVRRAGIEELLRTSDIISLHCPLLPSTKHLINRDTINTMKPGAMLVNTSRGPIVDEEALVDALRSGVIGGAGLDTYEVEPLPADSPLRALPNVILTSHAAAVSTLAEELLHIRPAEAARDYLQGKRPASVLI